MRVGYTEERIFDELKFWRCFRKCGTRRPRLDALAGLRPTSSNRNYSNGYVLAFLLVQTESFGCFCRETPDVREAM